MKDLGIFQDKIRKTWNPDKEDWFFSIVDVIGILSNSPRPRKYWMDLKRKLSDEGSQLSANIGQLKMKSSDGKFYLTDTADTKTILRIVQSIPSKKAEPFKIWLAEVSTTEISKKIRTETFGENKDVAKHGGKVAKRARKELEGNVKESVISGDMEMIGDKLEVLK